MLSNANERFINKPKFCQSFLKFSQQHQSWLYEVVENEMILFLNLILLILYERDHFINESGCILLKLNSFRHLSTLADRQKYLFINYMTYKIYVYTIILIKKKTINVNLISKFKINIKLSNFDIELYK